MNVTERPTESVREYENNPRDNDGAVDAVAASIREFGFRVPIIVDGDGVIVCGHTRLKAARKLGLKTVPCIVADDLTPDQLRAFRIADNRTAELSGWDVDRLTEELEKIELDMEPFGFSEEEMRRLTGRIPEVKEDAADEPGTEAEAVTKPGDVYVMGGHRLLCGDSTDPASMELLLDGGHADMLLTDPPYNVDYEGGTEDRLRIMNDRFGTENDFRAFLSAAFSSADGVMRPGAAFYIWHADSGRMSFQAACEETGWKVRENLIWLKNSFVMGRQDYQWKHEPCLYGWKDGAAHYFSDMRNIPTVLEFDRPKRNDVHPTMKPVGLFAFLIGNSSRPEETVLDPFGGSGTTLVACEQLGRKAMLSELDPRYCDVIVKRWEELTGKKAGRIPKP
jgi:DNA modification methylase